LTAEQHGLRTHPRCTLARVLRACWGAFIVYGTLLPFNISPSIESAGAKLRRAMERSVRVTSRSDAISNVLLFAPWGFLLAVELVERRRGLGQIVVAATCSGFGLSACVEAIQVFVPSRTPSALDLITNTLGSAGGAVCGWVFARRAWPRLRPAVERLARERPLATIALAASVLYVVAGLSPFDVSLGLGELKNSIKRARLIPFGRSIDGSMIPVRPWKWTLEFVDWTLIGGVYALALREAGRRGWRLISEATSLGCGLAAVVELAQLAIGGRVTDATSVVCAVAGAATGATCVDRVPWLTPRRWVVPALLVWGLGVVLSAWGPSDVAHAEPSSPGWDSLVPFLAYYRRTDVYALADIMDQTIRFVTVGALVAAFSVRSSVWHAAATGMGVAAVAEFGQLFVPGRTLDITDVLSAGAGAAMGWVCWRWAELKRRRLY
jgi:VanZ family protein